MPRLSSVRARVSTCLMPSNASHLTDLLIRERPALLRLARSILGHDSGAEDVIQSVWFKARGEDSAQRIDNPRAYLYRLVANLAEASGATTVVDSSKIATFGALLSRSPLLDVRPVHLVRDPRAVAYSWQREVASQAVEGYDGEMERFHAGKAAAMWLHSTISVGTAFSRRGAAVLDVRYEDFVADPAAGRAGPDGAVDVSSHGSAGGWW